MKKYSKLTLSLILVLAMVLQLSAVSFAADIGQIAYQIDGNVITASVAVRGLSEEAKLITAVYDFEGNFVVADESESVANSKDAFLKTTVTKSADSDIVKSFIWDADDHTPKTMPLTSGYEAKASDVKIYFDGIPFETVVGEALSFSKTAYSAKLTDADSDGVYEFPEVTYKVCNKTIDVDIVNDYEALTSTITVQSGPITTTTTEVTNTSTSTYETYTYAHSNTITVTFSDELEGRITDASYISAKDFGLGSMPSVTSASKYYDYVMTFEKDATANIALVNFTVTGLVNGDSIIVIEPTGDDATSAYRDTVVATDGTAPTWADDDKIVYAYDYAGTTEEEKLAEAFDASRATYNQYASTSPVTVTYDSGTAASARLVRRVTDSDNFFVTGNYGRYNDRYPAFGHIEFITPNTSLLNCNYISMANKDLASKELTINFYVNQSVKVHVVTNKSSITVKKSGDATGVTGTAGASGFSKRYQNTSTVPTFAYAVSKGYANINDLGSYNATTNKSYSCEIDGVTYTYKTDQVYYRKWASVYKLVDDGFSYGTFLIPEALEVLGYEAATDSTDTAKTYDITSMWNSGNLTGIQAAVDLYAKLGDNVGVAVPIITNPVMCSGYVDDEGNTIDFAMIDGTSTVIPVTKVFPDTASGNRSIFSDRDGINRTNLTGLIRSYPVAYDFEDGVFLQALMRAPQGSTNIHRACYNAEQVPFYTFTANVDCEVVIAYHTGLGSKVVQPLIDAGYTFHQPSQPIVARYDTTSDRNFNKFYTKKFNAGDTVTVYTPGAQAYVACFVKPIYEIAE